MRIWFSGPRIFGGLNRPGISFSSREIGKKAPKWNADAALGPFRRGDGAILLAVPGHNASEDMSGWTPVAVFLFGAVPAALEVRTGALVRLARHVDSDGVVTGLSVGQVCAAIRAEANDLALDPKFARVTVEPSSAPAHETSTGSDLMALLLVAVVMGVVFALAWTIGAK